MAAQRTPQAVGRPITWAAARLEPATGSHLPFDLLYDDYVAWCGREGHLPLKHGIFRNHLSGIADAVGIGVHPDGVDLVLGDSRLKATP